MSWAGAIRLGVVSSESKALAADAAAVGQDLAAIAGGHAGAETQLALAGEGVGLIGAFLSHDEFSLTVAMWTDNLLSVRLNALPPPNTECDTAVKWLT